MTEIRIDATGQLATDPCDFAVAVDRVRAEGLRGLWVRPDHLDRDPDAPIVDLALLRSVPELRSFGVAEGFAPGRVREFEAIYALAKLESLAIHDQWSPPTLGSATTSPRSGPSTGRCSGASFSRGRSRGRLPRWWSDEDSTDSDKAKRKGRARR